MNRLAEPMPIKSLVAGVDLGDADSHVCIIDSESGEVVEETRLRTRPRDVAAYFARHSKLRVAVEAGAQSNWVSEAITAAGHDVTVANAARVRLIHGGTRKNDRLDAQKLARLLRYDASLLAPIQHRRLSTHHDMAMLRSRDALVRTRTALVNHVRGVVKQFGLRVQTCETSAFAARARDVIPPELAPALAPSLDAIATVSEKIRTLTWGVERLCKEKYPETALLMQVHGVAEVTALTFVLTIENPARFARGRDVAAYLGLTPGEKQSGASNPARGITKAGDKQLRRLLVQCAHRILRQDAPETDLKRHGLKLARGGSKDNKRKAVVAVARKLAVLLHALWLSGEVYEPLRNTRGQTDRT